MSNDLTARSRELTSVARSRLALRLVEGSAVVPFAAGAVLGGRILHHELAMAFGMWPGTLDYWLLVVVVAGAIACVGLLLFVAWMGVFDKAVARASKRMTGAKATLTTDAKATGG